MLGSDKSLFFGSGTTLTVLNATGKTFYSMNRLHTHVSESTIYGRVILSRSDVMLSRPVDFLLLTAVMNLATSSTAMGRM